MQIWRLKKGGYVGREYFNDFGTELDPPLRKVTTTRIFNNCVRTVEHERKFIYELDDLGMRQIVGREPAVPRPGLEVVLRSKFSIPKLPDKSLNQADGRTIVCAKYVISCQSLITLLPELTPNTIKEDAFLHQLGTHLIEVLNNKEEG